MHPQRPGRLIQPCDWFVGSSRSSSGRSAAIVVIEGILSSWKELRAVRRTCGVDDAVRPAGISQFLKLINNVLHDRWLPVDAIQDAFHLHTSIVAL